VNDLAGMKILTLDNRESAYLVIPEGSQFTIEETPIRQNGKRFVLISIS